MYSFIKNNLYLFIAFITVSWAIINNIPTNEKTKTKYFFAQKDKNFITSHKNEVNLRNLNKYSQKLVKYLRYHTNISGSYYRSLDQYIKSMRTGQKGIYFITGCRIEMKDADTKLYDTLQYYTLTDKPTPQIARQTSSLHQTLRKK